MKPTSMFGLPGFRVLLAVVALAAAAQPCLAQMKNYQTLPGSDPQVGISYLSGTPSVSAGMTVSGYRVSCFGSWETKTGTEQSFTMRWDDGGDVFDANVGYITYRYLYVSGTLTQTNGLPAYTGTIKGQWRGKVDGNLRTRETTYVAYAAFAELSYDGKLEIQVESEAASYSLQMSCSQETAAWTVSSKCDWVSIQPAGGTGDGNVTISVKANASGAARSGTLEVAVGSVKSTFVVRQAVGLPTLFAQQVGSGQTGLGLVNEAGRLDTMRPFTGLPGGWIARDRDMDAGVNRLLVQQGDGGQSYIVPVSGNGDPMMNSAVKVYGAMPGLKMVSLNRYRVLAQLGNGGPGFLMGFTSDWRSGSVTPINRSAAGMILRSLDGDNILVQAAPAGAGYIWRMGQDGAVSSVVQIYNGATPGVLLRSVSGNNVLVQLGDSGPAFIATYDQNWKMAGLKAVTGATAGWVFRSISMPTDPSPPPVDYLVIDLSGGPNASSYPVSYRTSVPAGGWTDEYKTTKLVLRRITAGTFTIGSPNNELGRDTMYSPLFEKQYQVRLTRTFYLGVFEVTQRQWERVMGTWPSYFNNAAHRDSRPVEQVTYYQIRENPLPVSEEYAGSAISPNWPQASHVHTDSFMGRLRAKTGLATLDLPTEAQWEYACRAGTTTALNSGKNLTNAESCPNMAELGRYKYNGGSVTTQNGDTSIGPAKVGSYLPNAWDLYDMHGNVMEWCLDWGGDDASHSGTVVDPKGPTSSGGDYRVVKGGAFGFSAGGCRSAWSGNFGTPDYRGSAYNGHGFRVARDLP